MADLITTWHLLAASTITGIVTLTLTIYDRWKKRKRKSVYEKRGMIFI